MDRSQLRTRPTRLAGPHSNRPRQVGQWELVSLLGRGTWSEVYRARPACGSHRQAADYAVKLACNRPEVAELSGRLLRREVELGRALTHRHLIAILAAQLDRDPHYLVMPLLQGATVGQLVRARGRFSTADALWIARQAAEALAELHQAGWLHADIKPDNIMWSAQGHTTIFDLGFALRAGSDECGRRGELRGTVAYIAPEMISASEPVDQLSDIYSLGATLYEMLTGQPPFRANKTQLLAQAHLDRPVPNPRRHVPNLHPKVTKLLQHMLAKQPLRRPSATALVDRLVELEVLTFEERVA
jgi:serine/threonine-protein kinase